MLAQPIEMEIAVKRVKTSCTEEIHSATFVLLFVLLISCTIMITGCGGPDTRPSEIKARLPKTGDSVERVYRSIGFGYFGYEPSFGGRIAGYQYDAETGWIGMGHDPNYEFSEEQLARMKVLMTYARGGVIVDLVVVDGDVTDEMLDGGAVQFFEKQWDSDKRNGQLQ